jgi:hypothetical protein
MAEDGKRANVVEEPDLPGYDPEQHAFMETFLDDLFTEFGRGEAAIMDLNRGEGHPYTALAEDAGRGFLDILRRSLGAVSGAADAVEVERDEIYASTVYQSTLPGTEGIEDALSAQLQIGKGLDSQVILITPEIDNPDDPTTCTSREELQAVVNSVTTYFSEQGKEEGFGNDYMIFIGADQSGVKQDGTVKAVTLEEAAKKLGYDQIRNATIFTGLKEIVPSAIETTRVNPINLENEEKAVAYRDVGEEMAVITIASAKQGGTLESLVGGLIPFKSRRDGLNYSLAQAAQEYATTHGEDVGKTYIKLVAAFMKRIVGNDDKYGKAAAAFIAKRDDEGMGEIIALMEEAYSRMNSQALVDVANHIQETRNPDSLYITVGESGVVVGKRVMNVDTATSELAGNDANDTVYAGKVGEVKVTQLLTEASLESIAAEEVAAAERVQAAEEAAEQRVSYLTELQTKYATGIDSWAVDNNTETLYRNGDVNQPSTIKYEKVVPFFDHQFGKRDADKIDHRNNAGDAYLLLKPLKKEGKEIEGKGRLSCYGVTHKEGEDDKAHYFSVDGDYTLLEGLVDEVISDSNGETLRDFSKVVFDLETVTGTETDLFENMTTLYIKKGEDNVLEKRYEE